MPTPTAVAPVLGRRERTRAATIDEIKAVAREQLARQGSSSINLRAVARSMDITPSALYRYFASRDDMLTALITDAYNDLGAVVEASVADLEAADCASRFLTATAAFRDWAHAKPSEFGLLYGSPVPGYQASPALTKPPAMRTTNVLTASLDRGLEQGSVRIPFQPGELPPQLRAVLEAVQLGTDELAREPETTAVALIAWMTLLGFLTCEVFGHWPPEVQQGADEFFDFSMRRVLIAVGTDPDAAKAAKLVRHRR